MSGERACVLPTIQSAVDAAVEGDTVLIAPGTYTGVGNRNIDLLGKDMVITSEAGAEQTIIDCENVTRGFHVNHWESPAARIERLTIQNGNVYSGEGGGIYCDISSPTISECRILNCRAYEGGGLCLFMFGGVVDRCVIAGNWADDGGGGVLTHFSAGVLISNCLITGNHTESLSGGGVAFGDAHPGDTLLGCTVTANSSGSVAGGVACSDPLIYLHRCIIWGNCTTDGVDELYTGLGGAIVTCTDIDSTGAYAWYGTIQYTNCVFTDPLFCGPVECAVTTEGDWSVSSASPCLPENNSCHQLMGFGEQGCQTPGLAGACCFPDGSCVLVTGEDCGEAQGGYQGDGTTCVPNPCEPSPVEPTSWGRVKARFRGETK